MIRVLIDRQLGDESGDVLQRMMKQMRRQAIHRPGYVSGETLRDVADPKHYVILSTWRSHADWNAWFNSRERQEIAKQMNLVLEEPETIMVFELG